MVDLVAGDEWEEIEGGENDGESVVAEDDEEPLPPGRRQRTSGTDEEHVQSSGIRRAQVQENIGCSAGPPNLSSGALHEVNPRGASSWTLGGNQVQRKVTSSLGRRSRDNLTSDASQESNPPDKRLRLGSSVADMPSSPPTSTSGGQISISPNSDAATGTPGKPVSRRYLKQEYVPPRNRLVSILAKKLVQAEVLACHPWPNTATIESLVRRCWTKAIRIREGERSEIYAGVNDQPPTMEPDGIALEIVSSRLPRSR